MTEENKKIKLKKDDWKEIFPTEVFEIGKTTLHLQPLSFEEVILASTSLGLILDDVEGLLDDNDDYLGLLKKIPEITSLIRVKVPDVISIMSKLHEDDIAKLPLNILVDLTTKCIKINLESFKGLEKNFPALLSKMFSFSKKGKQMMQTTKAKTEKKPKRQT